MEKIMEQTLSLAPTSRLAEAAQKDLSFTVSVKNLAGEDVLVADPKATRALVAIMDAYATMGGAACHWGGPAAFAEMNSALHAFFFNTTKWFDSFNFINDAGHAENGIYALRANYGFDGMTLDSLKGFRSIQSKLTGHGESHLNPEGVLLSNGPLGSSASQAQGLAMADRYTGNDRTTVLVISDGAAMEGEAREAFAAIPGVASKGLLNPFVMLLSDNNTKLSGRIDDDAFSMSPTFTSLKHLGWDVEVVVNGNDIQEVYLATEKALAKAKANPKKAICLWVKTVKGYGVAETEESKSGGHGFPGGFSKKMTSIVSEIYGSESAPAEILKLATEVEVLANIPKQASQVTVPLEKVQAGFSRGAIAAKKAGLPLVSISADLAGSTGMGAFQKEFPKSSFDVGVAESNAFSLAAGFSKQGYLAITDTFAQFGATKGNLPLIMANLSQAPIVAVLTHAGFQDAADGASHQATHYYSAVASIPLTDVLAPCCSSEAEFQMQTALERMHMSKTQGQEASSAIFFAGRENFPVSYGTIDYQWGKAIVHRLGRDGVLLGFGYMVSKLLEVAELLKSDGLDVSVVSSAYVNQPDLATIQPLVENSKKLITLEDHQAKGGAGAIHAQALLEAGTTFSFKAIGIDGEFGQSAYLANELYEKHNMDLVSIANAFKAL
jgi:transketolase